MRKNIGAMALGLLAVILTVFGVKYIATPTSIEVPVLTGLSVTLTQENIDAIVNALQVENTGEVAEIAEVEEVITEAPELDEGVVESYVTPTQTNSAYRFELPANDSSVVFRKLTGVNYMAGLNAIMIKAPAEATEATLTITLDKKGTTATNFYKNTYTITVGYENCQVKDYIDWVDLPKTVSVDLTNVTCTNGAVKNFLPAFKDGKKTAVFFAKINGTTHDGEIVFE